MPRGRPPGYSPPRAPGAGLAARDALELLCLARGAPAHLRPEASPRRQRLQNAGLVRVATAAAEDGREVPDGYAVTTAGLRLVAAMRAEAAAEREEIAGGSDRDVPGEVAGRCAVDTPTRRVTTASKGA